MTNSEFQEIKELLEGTEIWSFHFENCVGIFNGLIYDAGKVVAKLTKKNAQILFDELCENEFGYGNEIAKFELGLI